MKRVIFITIGILIIVILIVIWMYVLISSNTPTNDESFTDLDLGDTTDTSMPTNPATTTNPGGAVVDIDDVERLRQLTTEPVAGYQEVRTSSTSPAEAYYILAGTGYVNAINLKTGEERRVSGVTIRMTTAGAITPDGKHVMIKSGYGATSLTTIGSFGSSTNELERSTLGAEIIDFVATPENTFLYSEQATDSVIAKEYNPGTRTTKTLFTTPFREAAIAWGNTADSAHYVYPKANTQLEGFVLRVKEGVFERLPIDGYGLSAAGNDSFVLYSHQNEEQLYTSHLYSTEYNEHVPFPVEIIPEKCAPLTSKNFLLYCGADDDTRAPNVPNTWYQGDTSYQDNIWAVSTDGSARFEVDPLAETGRSIDLQSPLFNTDNSNLYFKNKTDQTLWQYKIVDENT